jgi:hypothetical protein
VTAGRLARHAGLAVLVAATAPLALVGGLLGLAERLLGEQGDLDDLLSRPLRWALRRKVGGETRTPGGEGRACRNNRS